MSVTPPDYSKLENVEDLVSQLESFMDDNLNSFITQMNSDKAGPDLASIDSNAYYFQTLNEEHVPYEAFVFYGETNVTSEAQGPSTLTKHEFQVAVILAQTNEQAGYMGKRLLRYRQILKDLFEKGWNKVYQSRKFEVQDLAPFPFSLFNESATHVGIGVTLSVYID